MKSTGMTIATVLLGAGCAALIAGLQRILRREKHRQRATDRQISALAATVKTLEARVAELSRVAHPPQTVESVAAAVEGYGLAGLDEPKPETLAVITAAATAYLGKAARIRSVRLVPGATESVSPWSQQGRVIVQTSHNLRSRE
jgi:outer membrane murein-binding lipoprotein Lpp